MKGGDINKTTSAYVRSTDNQIAAYGVLANALLIYIPHGLLDIRGLAEISRYPTIFRPRDSADLPAEDIPLIGSFAQIN